MPPKIPEGRAFSYSNNELFARTSNQNVHRRATPAEIKEHFVSGSEKDHAAHWFEAQLIHYDLPVSKTKSVARMRLLDASNKGGLVVPIHISLLEAELRKNWIKDQREAKKKLKDDDTPAVATKRKLGASSGTPMKRTKADTAITNVKQESLPASKKSPPKFSKPQMARCNRGGHSQGPRRVPVKEESPLASPPRKIQTARRSHPFGMQAVTPRRDTTSKGFRDYYDPEDSAGQNLGGRLGPLGLLNGYYNIEAPWVKEQWSRYEEDEFTLVFTLAGNAMWAGFDLGVFSGVMFFRNRPRKSSMEKIPFIYRGSEAEGPIMYGNNNDGWIRFLGGGRIEGQLGFMSIDFRGEREPRQGTTSPRSASDMENEWDGYSESEYERERVARWH